MDLLNSNILITGMSSHQRRVEIIARAKTDLKVVLNQKKRKRREKKLLLVSLMRENDSSTHLQNLVSTYPGKRV